MSLCETLNRTILLMRDELSEHVRDEELVEALTKTTITLVADEKNLRTHSAQSAYVTTAMLLLRSGHRVYLEAPNIELVGAQPPLASGKLIDQLASIAPDIMPDVSFVVSQRVPSDLAILFGNTDWSGKAIRQIRLNATPWQAQMTSAEVGKIWSGGDWPIGAMGSAALGATEAFKSAMGRSAFAAQNLKVFAELFGPTPHVTIDLAPPATPQIPSLAQIDFVSAGAINSSALYALLRLPKLNGVARIIEHDIVSRSNLNRGMLFLISHLDQPKADILAAYGNDTFHIEPLPSRFTSEVYAKLGRLSDAVLVGVDDIPARWDVQSAWPIWLGIGATAHFNTMASFHTPDTACAGCLHPKDDPTQRPIPTAAFVSFWAGLWLATLYLRHLAGNEPAGEQQLYFAPLRPESVWKAPVQRRLDCPIVCDTRRPLPRRA